MHNGEGADPSSLTHPYSITIWGRLSIPKMSNSDFSVKVPALERGLQKAPELPEGQSASESLDRTGVKGIGSESKAIPE